MQGRRGQKTLTQAFGEMKADYAADRPSRFTRRRTGIMPTGSGADYHYRNEIDFLRTRELARDMDRNDAIVGQTIDRAKVNTVQDGISLDPQTGDPKLDAELRARWQSWCDDPEQCDLAGEQCFKALEGLVFRHMLVDGDIFALGTTEGSLQLIEAHRLRTPKSMQKTTVHGIKLDKRRRRVAFAIMDEDRGTQSRIKTAADVRIVPVRDANGVRQAFHIYSEKRISQTRGVTALYPIFDQLGMFEDINFAKLVQQQIVSCFAIFRERVAEFDGTADTPTGEQTKQTMADGSVQILEGIAPGMSLLGAPGERLTGFSPNVPNPEYFTHVKLILTLVGINLGLPLVLVLMDASETNFSGWRGAVDQARMGFRWNQKQLISRFHRPVYIWKLHQWAAADPALAALIAKADASGGKVDPFKHRWNPPRWPYIQPDKDAAADVKRLEKNLISPRRLHAERGYDWDEIADEIIEDRSRIIQRAISEAEAINLESPDARVDWRELAGFDQKGRRPDSKQRAMEDISRAVRSGVPIAVSEARVALGLAPEAPPGGVLRFNDQDVLQYHIESGLVTINEGRQRLNLGPVPWGDVPVRKTGVATVAVDEEPGESEAESEGDEGAEDERDG